MLVGLPKGRRGPVAANFKRGKMPAMRNDEARTQCYCVPGLVVLRAHDGSVAVVLVKQTRHVAFFHEGAGRGEALRGELFGRDAGAKDFLGCADGGD